MTPDVIARAQAWLAEDPDPDTRGELAALLRLGETAAISDRFAGRLEFGTAGLRGALGAGPTRMNCSVVRRTAAGLVAYLKEHDGKAVVIGFDARHKSDLFARETAAVVSGAGLRAMVLPRPLPTPVLAYAIRHVGADAGVMVTASHNPPQDNGYKVYVGDGAQIASPVDAEISAAIDAVGPLSTVPMGNEWITIGHEVINSYLDRASALVAAESPRDLAVTYTPLHGVGRDIFLTAMTRAGFAEPRVVAEQAEPDPDFPTLPFPNPEEPGAMDLALAEGTRTGADIVIANDPDADRCAVAVPLPSGGWRMLRGDEVGALLAVHIARRGVSGTFATTIVSSSLLGKIANAYGLGYGETLTGFKWLSRVPGLVYGYEEALGYCVDPSAVRDKDGITAALLVCELAAGEKAIGRTLLDLLDEIAREYGLHATSQVSIPINNAAEFDQVLARLRARPPAALGGRTVTAIDDLASGADSLPPTAGLRYWLRGKARIVVRPSGTEPKIKCYFEVTEPVPGGDVETARERAGRALAGLEADLAAELGQ